MLKILSRPKIFSATFSKDAKAVRPRFEAARPKLLISMGHLMTGKMSRKSARAAATNAKSESCVEKTSISQTKSRLRIALVRRFATSTYTALEHHGLTDRTRRARDATGGSSIAMQLTSLRSLAGRH